MVNNAKISSAQAAQPGKIDRVTGVQTAEALCKGKKFHIQTFGCQMNEHDSETIAGMLTALGMESCEERKNADVAIINTCSVRENADKRFFGTLGQLKKIKEQRPDFTVCICGCMMQQQHIIDTVKQKYSWVDIIFGTHNIHEFPKLITSVIGEKHKLVDVWPEGGEIVEGLPAKRLYKHKAYVNIMYGCNNFCTYCIVPYTRGRERSRRPEDIVREIKALAADGVKEVMLLGQNVNSYKGLSACAGQEEQAHCGCQTQASQEKQAEYTDFAALLHMINDIDGIERIRFMTSHPKDLSDRLIAAFGECDKLCKCIHLPVQSGSSRILKRMNRHYTREDYLALVRKLRAAVPDIAVTTDIIVGFPGETAEDFAETLSLCREVGYDSAFTFLYSIRKGTPAEKFENQIPEEEKHRRFNMLVDVINESSAEKNAAYVGRVERVLVESESKSGGKKRAGTYAGRTSSFKLVNFEACEELIGKFVDVRITGANTFSLTGEIVSESLK